MKKIQLNNYDVLVVGAGLIGSLTGLALLKKGFKVLVIEKNSPQINDNRTVAINANSKDFLKSLRIWDKLKITPEPINKIEISSTTVQKNIYFEDQFEPLGYVAYNREILSLVREELINNSSLLFNVFVAEKNLKMNKNIIINRKLLLFKHIIFSTGKNNNYEDQYSFSSNHHAYVGFFHHSNDHKNVAYENFTDKGPLAILPAPAKNKLYSTFIYSTSENMQLKSISSLIQKNFLKSHGKIKLNKEFFKFKISPKIIKENNQNNIFIGDALRSIHPVAGQGWNLGIKDIQALLDVIDNYYDDSENLIKQYYSRRIIESFTYLTFTTLLNNLFENQNFLKKIFIKASFKLFDLDGIFKKNFIKQAMGRSQLL